MAISRHLNNAPITEALIDLRVRPPKSFQVEKLREPKKELRDHFPKLEELRRFEGGFQIKRGEASMFSKDTGLSGFRFKSEDGLTVVQFRVDGFTFSRLKPYTSWDAIFPEAWRLWLDYVETAVPESVTRIAVRYINRLEVPLPFEEFSEYLEAPPALPPDVPQNVSSFLVKQVLHEPSSGIAVNFGQALEAGLADSKHATIILDIDSYKVQEYEPQAQHLTEEFESLRRMKNLIFFNSITEKTARLFE